jgi:AraC-like DNA-binding protein
MGPIKFTLFPPPEILKNEVACFRITEYTGEEGLTIKVCLNGLPGIVFQHNQGRSPVESIVTSSRSNFHVPTLYLYGQTTEPGLINHKKGPYTMVQVILKPHALKTLLGLNASTLTNNGLVELNEFSAEDLNGQLLEAHNEQERMTLLTNFLLAQLKQEKTRDRLVEESLRLIHQNRGSMTVKRLLDQLHISERHFERRFSQTVGLTPQFYIRVKRFNEAVRLMKTGQVEKLTDVAHALNYYDQAHFIRDLKAFSGLTPKRLAQREGDFLHGQTGFFYV